MESLKGPRKVILMMPLQPGYPDAWKKSVIQDTGNKLLVPAGEGH